MAGKYKAGSSFLEYSTSSGFYSTTRKERQGDIKFADIKTSGKQIGIGIGSYFLDNFAGLLELGISSSKIKSGPSTTRTRSVNIHPTIIAQVPVEGPLNNLFLQAGYNYTHVKQSSQNKQLNGYLGVRAGYNYFFTKNLALTPKFGYETGRETRKSVGGDLVSKWRGPAAELSIRAWLNWKWK